MTAAEKLTRTLKELSQPEADANELELTLATIAMGAERGLAEKIDEAQQSGELDAFVLQLTRWFAQHRSDSERRLVVIEMPRQRDLPAGTRLHLLEEALAAAEAAPAPW